MPPGARVGLTLASLFQLRVYPGLREWTGIDGITPITPGVAIREKVHGTQWVFCWGGGSRFFSGAGPEFGPNVRVPP